MSTLNTSDVMKGPLDQQLETIFRAHYRMIYRTAYGVTGSAEDAEDIAQTIFLRLARRDFPPSLKTNPGAYLYRAAVNLSLDAIRRRKRWLCSALPSGSETQFDEPEADQAEERHRRLYEAVAKLAPTSAEILILRYVHDHSDAEIARMLGTSRGTIAVSLYRSRSRLKKLMRNPHPPRKGGES